MSDEVTIQDNVLLVMGVEENIKEVIEAIDSENIPLAKELLTSWQFRNMSRLPIIEQELIQ